MKKWIIPIVTLVILVGGVAAGIFLVRQSTEFREKAAPATSLSFNTTDTTVDLGESFLVLVHLDTGENQLDAVQIAINYDPNILQADSVTKGNFFIDSATLTGPNIIPEENLIEFAILMPFGSTPVRGSGTAAIISFTAISEGTTTLSYIDRITYYLDGQQRTIDTLATDPTESNVLASTTPITITVQSTQTQPTATPTPTGSDQQPTATPTPTTPAPTNTPTPSPTPTSDAGTGGPNPTNTPTPTATPTQSSSGSSTPTPTPTSARIAQNLVTPTPTQLMESGVEANTYLLMILGALSVTVSGIFLYSIKS